MEFVSLGSGSKGNSFYLGINGKNILIDVGLSMKQTNLKLLSEVGIDLDDVNLVFITHAHSDHVKSLNAIHNKYMNIKFLMTKETYETVLEKTKKAVDEERLVLLRRNDTLKGKNFDVTNYELQHDLPNFAFKFLDKSNKETILHIPDNGGYIYKDTKEKWIGCTYYSIESNYDTYMQVFDDKRQDLTKRRTLGGWGHMSNHDAIFLAFKLVNTQTKGIIFQHLSEDCNDLQVAKEYHQNLIRIFGNVRQFQNLTIKYAVQNEVVRLI